MRTVAVASGAQASLTKVLHPCAVSDKRDDQSICNTSGTNTRCFTYISCWEDFGLLSISCECGIGTESLHPALPLGEGLLHEIPPRCSPPTCVPVPQGTSAEPLVRMGSIDSQFEAFQRVITLNPALWKSNLCNKTSLAKGVNWVRLRNLAPKCRL